MRYFDLNVGDWIAATAHLSDAEELAYFRLLLRYYATEAPLPADVAACAKLARAKTKEQRQAVESVLRDFFDLTDDGWHQKRADEEIARFYDKSAKAKASASVSAEVRKRKADAKRTLSERTSERSAEAELPTTHDPLPMTQENPPSGLPVGKALPGTLSEATWREWKSHLSQKGRPLSTPTERAQLARLGLELDAEAHVRRSLERGWLYLDPPGAKPHPAAGSAQAVEIKKWIDGRHDAA